MEMMLIPKNIKKISRAQVKFGQSKDCDYQITKISSSKGKQSFEIFDRKNSKAHKFKINLPGKHNVFNLQRQLQFQWKKEFH